MESVMIEPGLHVVSLATALVPRSQARVQIRAALRELVGLRLGISADEVTIRSLPGSAPQLLLGGQVSAQGVSITHAGQFACAAFHSHGAVGIDVMQVQQVPDMDRVALDYLGPEVHAMLASVSPARRADLFAHAWARREAHLKCLGQALAEFEPLPGNCRVHALAVPDGYAGVLVTQPLGRAALAAGGCH
jgi:4'-phosphopantetheinyl transferase